MRAATEICLVLPPAPSSAKSLARLAAALDAATVSTVIIALPENGAPDTPAIKALVELVQKRGIAALITNDAALARIVKADGVHLAWAKDQSERYAAARGELGARFIVGADAGRSRHDAMTLGESGADYVAFGIPPHVEDRATARERQADLIGWWSDIFQVPCVAVDVTSQDDAVLLAEAGADFIAMTMPLDGEVADVAGWVRGIGRAIATTGTAAEVQS